MHDKTILCVCVVVGEERQAGFLVPYGFWIDNHPLRTNLISKIPSQTLDGCWCRFNCHNELCACRKCLPCEHSHVCPAVKHDISGMDAPELVAVDIPALLPKEYRKKFFRAR